MSRPRNLRKIIAQKVRELRISRHMSQVELGAQLGLSQGRLSEIERGDGSFTAEQLLVLLKVFNVTVNHFAPPERDVGPDSSAQGRLQNALARLGASHLREDAGVLPTERLAEVTDVIRETLLEGAPRQHTALAPVLVGNIRSIRLRLRWQSLVPLGLDRRLGWVMEHPLEASSCRTRDSLNCACAAWASWILAPSITSPPGLHPTLRQLSWLAGWRPDPGAWRPTR